MIEKLTWDSDFFGYNVGRIIFGDAITRDHLNMLKVPKGFRLVYAFSQSKLPHEFDEHLADRKIVFHKHLSDINNGILITDFDLNTHSWDELVSLAYLSGSFSRYKTDNNFKNDEFRQLYDQWIQNSLNNSNTRILVTTSGSTITGFITVELFHDEKAKIGLVSVNENFQGRGLGSMLIKMAENVALQSGRTILQVATQFDNKPAMTLYDKNGFETLSSTFIYHLWKL